MRVLLLLVLLPAVALAQAKSPALAEVEALYGEGEFEEALKKANAALPRSKSPNEAARLQLARGLVLLAIGQAAEARAAFTAALKKDVTVELDPARVSPEALDLFSKARAEFPATVSITVSNGGGSVRVDDQSLGPAPLTTQLAAGKHVFEAVAADGRRARVEKKVDPGAKVTVTLELPPAVVAAKPDSKPVEPKPVARPDPKPDVKPTPPEDGPPASVVVRRSGGKSLVGLVPIGLGVAVALGGVGALAGAGGNYEALLNGTQRFTSQEETDLVEGGKTLQTLGWLGVSLGAASVVTGVIMLLLAEPAPDAPTLSVVVTPHGSFVGVQGSFP